MTSTKESWGTLFQCVVIVFILVGCKPTTVRQHPEFANDQRRIKTVALLPPEVEHTRIVFTGDNERLTQKEDEIRLYLTSAMKNMLKRCGYEPSTDFLDRLSGNDKTLMFDYEQFKTAYGQASKELYKSRAVDEGESKQFRVNTGLTTNNFVNSSGADAVLLVRYQGFEKSGGQQAKEIVASALLMVLVGSAATPAPFGSSVELALIDGKNGEVLWSNALGAPQKYPQVFQQAIAPLEKQYTRKKLLPKTKQAPGEAPAGEPLEIAKATQADGNAAISNTNLETASEIPTR